MKAFKIKEATENEVSIILELIKALAVYEKMSDQVIATEAQLKEALFTSKVAKCVIGFEGEYAVGFALYFYNFSTFVGKKGLYLEDLFVMPEHRGKGYGKDLLLHLKNIATQENCGRMEWSVLDWNQPAIDFYKSLGATSMNEWTVMRFEL